MDPYSESFNLPLASFLEEERRLEVQAAAVPVADPEREGDVPKCLCRHSPSPDLSQLHPNLSQLNPNLSQLNPNLSQLHPNLSQLNPNLSQLNPNLTQLNPDLSQLNPNLTF